MTVGQQVARGKRQGGSFALAAGETRCTGIPPLEGRRWERRGSADSHHSPLTSRGLTAGGNLISQQRRA